MHLNPILIVEDDADDKLLLQMAVSTLKIERPVCFFSTGDELLHYLKTCEITPFLILSEVTLQTETGFDLKTRISKQQDLRYKTVPFVFWANTALPQHVQHAYDITAQGFFLKPGKYDEICSTLNLILQYWLTSLHPICVT